MLLGLALSAAAPAAEPDLSGSWSAAQGLMAGVVVIHGVQPVAAWTGQLEWQDKMAVSIAGTALYGATLGGLLARQDWALYTAIIGPCVGLAAVGTGFVLSRTGVIDADIHPDVFQVAGGLLQLPAAVIAARILRAEHAKEADDIALWVGAAPGLGLQVGARF